MANLEIAVYNLRTLLVNGLVRDIQYFLRSHRVLENEVLVDWPISRDFRAHSSLNDRLFVQGRETKEGTMTLDSKQQEAREALFWNQVALGSSYDSLWFAGGFEYYWIAYYQFAERIGVKFSPEQSKALQAWADYAETCGPLYAYEEIAFVSRRPEILSFDEEGRLHAEKGPAMCFKSGYALYAWNGTRVPSHWIEKKNEVSPAEILSARNVELRMAGCKILGWARMAEQLSMKILDGDPNTDIGALIELTLPGLPQPGRFLMAQCPRNGTICEGVPNVSEIDKQPIQTAIAAQAWRDGLPLSEYTFPKYRV